MPTFSDGESSSLCGCDVSGLSHYCVRRRAPSAPGSSPTSSSRLCFCSPRSQPCQLRRPVLFGSCLCRCGASALLVGWTGCWHSWRLTDGTSAEKQRPTEGKEEERRSRKRALEMFKAVESVLRCTCQKKVNI